MAKKNKPGNFLKEIQKQSEEQRNQLLNEISTAKKEAIANAKVKFQRESEKFVANQISLAQTDIKSNYALKALENQGELFKLRETMLSDTFDSAKEKLIEYSNTNEYLETLLKLAKEIAVLFSEKNCIIYLKNDDMKFKDEIAKLFKGEADFMADDTILIGGIKGFCESMNIVADNTLDSKLENERSTFIEKTNLKIL